MMDVSRLNILLATVSCPSCDGTDVLHVTPCDDKRKGFALFLKLTCSSCATEINSTYSSPQLATGAKPKPYTINDSMVLFFNRLGLGHTAVKEFCAILGIPAMHLKTFQKKQHAIVGRTIKATDDVMRTSVAIVRKMHLDLDPDFPADQPVPITVSFDGTWQKRGHTSMYGVAAVIEVVTGLVIDYVVLSTYCHSCSLKRHEFRDQPDAFNAWYAVHKEDCSINYTGSSNAMEVEAAKRLWGRSLALGLMYTGLVGDGDSKAYQAVVHLEPYGPGTEILKEECINHAHKRMGTALLKLTKGQKLGGRGQGRLTKDKAIRLQHYYRFAITADATPNIESMRTRIWATLFHCASTDDEPQHDRCPDGIDSWCFYKRAVAADEEPPCHADNVKHALAADVCKAMVPVYQRMSDTNLLKRLQKGQTQNSNECLHSVIWSRCSKTVFVGHRKLHGAVASAVGCFNEGATHLTRVMDLLAIESNEMTQAFVASRDAVRIAKSEQARKGSTKESRKRKADVRKRERAHAEAQEGPAYEAGGFD